MEFYERLKLVRENKGFKQTYIAERLGVDKSTLSGYETGKREPNLEVINRLADIYEVTVDYLLGRSTDPRITAEQEKRIDEHTEKTLDILEALNEKDRAELETMIRVFLEMKKLEIKKEQTKKSGD